MSSGVVFRGWSASKSKDDPEIKRLEEETEKAKKQIHQLRERGRHKRVMRLQALDALETRRMTLREILKRMDKEIAETDVYKYSEVLAEVFGERKIFAHRAIGLEALLCQFMHQMLAKQHQLKIIKKSAKDIQSHYKQHKLRNKDEFHSFEALAVQMEASRLSLEAMYDDIFASQHALLAQLNNVQAGGTATNYKVVKKNQKLPERKPSLSVSTKHPVSADDLATPDAGDGGNHENNDYEAAMDILSHHEEEDPVFNNDEKKDQQREEKVISSSSASTRRVSEKSARERRREIEHLRHARVIGGGSGGSSRNFADSPTTEDDKNARERMRELEEVRQRVSPSSIGEDSNNNNSASARNDVIKIEKSKLEELEDRKQELQERRSSKANPLKKNYDRSSRQSKSPTKQDADESKERRPGNSRTRSSTKSNLNSSRSNSNSSKSGDSLRHSDHSLRSGDSADDDEDKRRERRERRKERAAVRRGVVSTPSAVTVQRGTI